VARRGDQYDRIRTKLTPDIFSARQNSARAQIEALWRLAQSYHPDKPLQRGYARVSTRDGGVISTAKAARIANRLTLHFADGAVDTHVDTAGGQTKVEPRTKPRYAGDKVAATQEQPKLL